MKEENTALTSRVRQAMGEKRLKVYYQPQYDATNKKLRSSEALVRWVDEDGSIIMPGEFIPELEKSDAITELDWYMVEEVCIFQRKMLDAGISILPVSVNFSRWHISEENVADRLVQIADRYKVDYKYLTIEITESALLSDQEKMQAMIADIRSRGFRTSIDDFGSGLSSLSFVKDIQADELKIDKSLLNKNCEDEKERIVLESIFLFANRLKLKTVAEGVETKEQLGFLRTCNCELIQGFFFDRPLTESDYVDRLKGRNISAFEEEDILTVQTPAAAVQLLLDAIYTRYPLIIYINLTRNSFYMMTYEHFTTQSCPSTGNFDELIQHGSMSMHPDDRQKFADTFSGANLMKRYNEGARVVQLITRQIGDDGIYRKVETSDYFVKNPASEDVLVICLCDLINE